MNLRIKGYYVSDSYRGGDKTVNKNNKIPPPRSLYSADGERFYSKEDYIFR